MSTTHNPNTGRVDGAQPTIAVTDDWVPEDRAPSAAESNFMSFSLFAFLILFGIGCFVVF